ncbi:MAG: DUF4139 domain-containing protein [Deltaproteobacteria bacterium]|nr:DUF4139 domain-containing protein [Deltaproteobacteria bacterium]
MLRMNSSWWSWAWAMLLFPAAAAAQPASRLDVGGEARTAVNVTVYNQNMALVREVRQVELPRGVAAVRWQDVAAQIRPETVHVGAPGSAAATFGVLEQNYKYDLLTPTRLMELYVDRQLTLVTVDPDTGVEESERATLLSAEGYQYVYRTDEGITFNVPGRVVFPEVPPNFVQRPTLEWLLDSGEAGARPIEASYLTYGMSWSADYVVVLDADDAGADITGWVTLRNNSGIGFAGAGLQLVAGNVNLVTYGPADDYRANREMRTRTLSTELPAQEQFVEQGMFEYHLYTLQRPTDLADREQKQIELLSAAPVPVEKKYRLEGYSYWYVSEQSGPLENLPVDVWIEFRNAEEFGLGIPMPAGVMRVYKADSSGGQQFLGEDAIEHTPREERIKLRLGQAFDVVADRRQTDYEILTDTLWETAWEVTIRNHKDVPVVVELREPMGGDWEVVSASHEWTKESSSLLLFKVPVRPGEEAVVTYRVRSGY